MARSRNENSVLDQMQQAMRSEEEYIAKCMASAFLQTGRASSNLAEAKKFYDSYTPQFREFEQHIKSIEDIRVSLESLMSQENRLERQDIEDLEGGFRRLISNWDAMYLHAEECLESARGRMLQLLKEEMQGMIRVIAALGEEEEKLRLHIDEVDSVAAAYELKQKIEVLASRVQQAQPLKEGVCSILHQCSTDSSLDAAVYQFAEKEEALKAKFNALTKRIEGDFKSLDATLGEARSAVVTLKKDWLSHLEEAIEWLSLTRQRVSSVDLSSMAVIRELMAAESEFENCLKEIESKDIVLKEFESKLLDFEMKYEAPGQADVDPVCKQKLMEVNDLKAALFKDLLLLLRSIKCKRIELQGQTQARLTDWHRKATQLHAWLDTKVGYLNHAQHVIDEDAAGTLRKEVEGVQEELPLKMVVFTQLYHDMQTIKDADNYSDCTALHELNRKAMEALQNMLDGIRGNLDAADLKKSRAVSAWYESMGELQVCLAEMRSKTTQAATHPNAEHKSSIALMKKHLADLAELSAKLRLARERIVDLPIADQLEASRTVSKVELDERKLKDALSTSQKKIEKAELVVQRQFSAWQNQSELLQSWLVSKVAFFAAAQHDPNNDDTQNVLQDMLEVTLEDVNRQKEYLQALKSEAARFENDAAFMSLCQAKLKTLDSSIVQLDRLLVDHNDRISHWKIEKENYVAAMRADWFEILESLQEWMLAKTREFPFADANLDTQDKLNAALKDVQDCENELVVKADKMDVLETQLGRKLSQANVDVDAILKFEDLKTGMAELQKLLGVRKKRLSALLIRMDEELSAMRVRWLQQVEDLGLWTEAKLKYLSSASVAGKESDTLENLAGELEILQEDVQLQSDLLVGLEKQLSTRLSVYRVDSLAVDKLENVAAQVAEVKSKLFEMAKSVSGELAAMAESGAAERRAWLQKVDDMNEWAKNTKAKCDATVSALSDDIPALSATKLAAEADIEDLNDKWKLVTGLERDLNNDVMRKVLDEDAVVKFKLMKEGFEECHRSLLTLSKTTTSMIRAKQKAMFNTWKSRFEASRKALQQLSDDIPERPGRSTVVGVEEWINSLKRMDLHLIHHLRQVDDLTQFCHEIITKQLAGKQKRQKKVEADIVAIRDLLNVCHRKIMDCKASADLQLVQAQRNGTAACSEWMKRLASLHSWITSSASQMRLLSEKQNLANDVDAADKLLLSIEEKSALLFGLHDEAKLLAASEDLNESMKLSVESSLTETTEEWNQLIEIAKVLQEKLDQSIYFTSKLDSWREQLSPLKAFVDAKEHVLTSARRKTSGEAKVDLESLLAELHQQEPKMQEFHFFSQQFASEELLAADSVTEVHAEPSFLVQKLSLLKDLAQSEHSRVSVLIDQQNDAESRLLKEWSVKSTKIGKWLGTAEAAIPRFDGVAEDLVDLEEQIREHEELVYRLTMEEKYIDELIDSGLELSSSEEQIQTAKLRQQVKDEVMTYQRRKENLNLKLTSQQQLFSAQRAAFMEEENELIHAWLQSAARVKTTIEQFEDRAQEEVVRTPEDVRGALVKHAALQEELEEFQHSVSSLFKHADEILKAGRLSQLRSDEIKTEMKSLHRRWKQLKSTMESLLARYKSIQLSFARQFNDEAEKFLARLKLFNEWLALAKQQLQSGWSPSKNASFQDLVQREHGLKKLSRDLESRAQELDDLVLISRKICQDEVEDMTPKQVEAMEKTEALQNEWDDVVAAIDKETDSVRNMLMTMLDSRRGSLQSELNAIEHNISVVTAFDVEEEKVKKNTEKIAELSNQLSRLKSTVDKLGQQTTAMETMSVLSDDEKSLLKQSQQELVHDYEKALKQIDDAKNGSRSSLLGRFTKQSEKTKIKVSELARSRLPFDADEDRLDKLKEYLVSEQKILNEVKLEQVTLNDLGRFAEEVCAHGTVSHADQMAVSVALNEALTAIEDLRQDCQARVNRIYAVMLHLIKQALQQLLDDLAELQSTAVALGGRSIAELPHATAALQAFKNIRLGQDGIGAKSEHVREQIRLLTDAALLENADLAKLEGKCKELTDDVQKSNLLLEEQKILLDDRIRELVSMKLDELWGWLPILHKRSEESTGIGPDLVTVKKQIQEMKVIEKQSQEKSMISIEGDDVIIQSLLRDETIRDIQAASDEWLVIRRWIATRTKRLDQAHEAWELFRRCELDLLDYLRENEKLLKNWNSVDLNDPASVEARHVELRAIMTGMEARKGHVKAFNDAADQLTVIVGAVEAIANSIRSQVSDIHELWNSVVKQVIEAGSKLEAARKKLQTLNQDMSDVRSWLDDANQMMKVMSPDAPKDIVEDAMKKLEKHRETMEDTKWKLDRMNCLSEELLADADFNTHFTIHASLQVLNEDWVRVESRLHAPQSKPWYGGLAEAFQPVKRLFSKSS